MKKLLVLILSVVAAFAAAISLTACDNKPSGNGETTITDGDKLDNSGNNGGQDDKGDEAPEHSHTYNKQVATQKYLKSAATCTAKAVYYFSCKCGEKGTQTFEYGDKLPHTFDKQITEERYLKSAATCTAKATYYYSCECGEKGAQTFEYGDKLPHTYNKQVATQKYLKSAATCTAKAVYYYSCKCGEKGTQTFEYGALSTIHPFSSKWMNDQTYHYHKSTCIHQVEKDKEKHIFNSNDVCSVCGVEKQVEIQLYIDGGYSESIYTDKTKGYKISEPEKPEDISTNPNSEKYFYGWFTDYNYQTPFTDNTTFKTNSKLYAKWVTVYSTDYRYSVSYGKATITGYKWSSLPTVLVIPAYINSFPVKNIAIDAFKDRTEIRTVILCDGIEEISGFNGCNSITKVVMPESVKCIGAYCFSNCGFLNFEIPEHIKLIDQSAFSGCSSLASVTIPSSVERIGHSAFSGCYNLAGITIPDGVTSIGNGAFHGCSKLTSVTIPDSVTSIGDWAFYDCTSLTSVTIPDSVTSIGKGAFSGCSGLREITIPFVGDEAGKTASDTYQYPFGYMFGTNSYNDGIATKQYYYGSSTSSTTYDTFFIPSSLKKVTVTGGNILYGAFHGCSKLTSVTIPDSVTSIGDWAFYDCTSLTSVTIPDSVTSIGYRAFYDCTSLTSVTIGNSVTSIGWSAFEGCSSLEFNKYDNGLYLGNETNKYVALIKSKTQGVKSTTISDECKLICYEAFHGCSKLTSITIPDGVTSIGSYAFSGCSSLTSVTIPDSVTSIGDYTFYGCSSLKTINYKGSKEQCNSISKGSYWNYNTGNYAINYNYIEN